MRILYLVGNGFDMACGLDTSPVAFLNDFIETSALDPGSNAHIDLAERIKEEGVDCWADYESKIGQYSSRFQPNAIDEYLEQVNALTLHMHSWLEKKNKTISKAKIDSNAREVILSLKKYVDALSPGERDVVESMKRKLANDHCYYDILSFNYTTVLPKVFDTAKTSNSTIGALSARFSHILGSIVQVHGSLLSIPVMGVNDSGQIANDSFRDNPFVVSNIVKSSIQREIGSKDDMAGMDFIKSGDIICIFGMSLGETDRRWWRAVANRLKQNKEAILIIFSWEYAIENPHTPLDRYRIVKREKEKFFCGAGLASEVIDAVEKRFFVAKSTAIFSACDKFKAEK